SDAPRGNIAIVRPRLVLSRAFVFEAALGAFEIGRHLAPDRLELVVDQCGRKLEGVALIERVEQRALDLEPRGPGAILLQALLDGVTQLGARLESEALGELVVERRGLRRSNLLDLHREARLLAG